MKGASLVLLIAALASVIGFPGAAAAHDAEPIPESDAASLRVPVTATWELSDDAIVLDGYTDSVDFEIARPVGWEMPGSAHFDANVHTSDIAGDDATLRLDIGGRPMISWGPHDDGHLRLELPPETPGIEPARVAISTTSSLTVEAECPDPNHVGRWFDIGRPTITGPLLPSPDLGVADAVRGLAHVSALTDEPIVLAPSSDPGPGELNAIGAMIAALGQHARPHGWVVEHEGRDLRDRRERSGRGGTGALGSRVVFHVDPKLDARARVDATGSRPTLHIEGTEQSIAVLAHALADPDRLPFFAGADVSLRTSGVPAASASPVSDVFTFDDGGYESRTLRGYGTQGLQYQVRLPAQVVPDAAVISLDGSFGPHLGNHEASITVTLNGGDAENVALADKSGRLAVLHELDASDLRPGLNYISVDVQLGIPRAPCTAVIGAQASWFTVSPSSSVAIKQSESDGRIDASVAELRFALAAAADFEQTDIVIGNSGSASLSHVADLIGEMAFRAEARAPRLVVEADLQSNRHLVLVGEVDQPDLAHHVPAVETGLDLGIVSIVPSPLRSNRLLISFTGGTGEALDRTIDAGMSSTVNDVNRDASLIGEGVIRDLDGDPSALYDLDDGDSNIGRTLDRPPPSIPYVDIPGPTEAEYEEWLATQLDRIAAARAPETDTRRAVAIGLLLCAAVLGGLVYILKLRRKNDDEADGGHH